MLSTTFNLLKLTGACGQASGSGVGYDKLAVNLGGVTKYGKDTPISLVTVLDSNGLDDVLWCLKATLPEQNAARDKLARLLVCDYVERAFLSERAAVHEPDAASWGAIEVSRRFAHGEATQEELVAAWVAASGAAWVAAWGAAWEAARGAEIAWQTAHFRQMLEASNAQDLAQYVADGD